MELAGLDRPGAAVLAGDSEGTTLAPLPRSMGGRPRLLGAQRAMGAPYRSHGLVGLAGDGADLFTLVARLPRAGSACGFPAQAAIDDGSADSLGRHGVHSGLSPYRLPLVLPRPQPVQLPDRPGQCLVPGSFITSPLAVLAPRHPADPKTDGQTLDRDAIDGGKPGLWGLSAFHGPVPSGPPTGTLANQFRAAVQDGRRSTDDRGADRALDPTRDRRATSSRPDHLARDCVSVRVHRHRPGHAARGARSPGRVDLQPDHGRGLDR